MTQVQTMTNQELNRKLAELMGWTIRYYKYTDSYVLVTSQGKTGSREGTEAEAWSDVPDYCTDPASSLEVQAKAIEASADKYVSNLDAIINPIAMQDNWRNYEISRLLTATPRERAEAAYITLQGEKGNG